MRRHARPRPTGRPGFTLVELIVAAGLTLVVMAILATAFQTGTDTLSQLKSVAGLAENLRAAQEVIKRDLGATHLEDEQGKSVRVSDPLLATTPWTTAAGKRGYFFVRQGSQPFQNLSSLVGPGAYYYANPTPPNRIPYQWEGQEDGVDSFRAVDHLLSMTVKLDGSSAQEAFAARAPGKPHGPDNDLANSGQSLKDLDPGVGDPARGASQLYTRWGEVAYYLVPTGAVTADAPGASGLASYTLYRRRWLLTEDPFQTLTPAPGGTFTPFNPLDFPELSVQLVSGSTSPSKWRTNTPADVTGRLNRWGGTPFYQEVPNPSGPPTVVNPSTPALNLRAQGMPHRDPTNPASTTNGAHGWSPVTLSGPDFGADVLLTNVLSCQVRVLFDSPQPQAVVPEATMPPVPKPVPPFQFHDIAAAFPYAPAASATSSYPPGQQVSSYPQTHYPRRAGYANANYPAGATADALDANNIQGIYDTADPRTEFPIGNSPPTLNPKPRVKAIQLKLRVYDYKNKVTRQITVAQDL